MTRTVGIIGCGSLGALIAEGIASGLAGPYRIAGLLTGSPARQADALAALTGAPVCVTLGALLDLSPDYVVEAAGAEAVRQMAAPSLSRGAHLVVLSTGAFIEQAFYDRIAATALENGRTVYLVPGAIGGLDLVQAASLAGGLTASIANEKPPQALEGAPGVPAGGLSRETITQVFRGTARDAVRQFPRNVNVVATLALAAGGIERVSTSIVSDPSLSRNRHIISLSGSFGEAELRIESAPSARNPKSSSLAAYSVLAKLKSLAAPIQF